MGNLFPRGRIPEEWVTQISMSKYDTEIVKT